MRKIILDTNFLLIPAQFRVDIFSEIHRIMETKYELCIIDKTLDELESIKAEQKQKHRRAAKLALELIKAKDIKTIETEKNKNVDQLILDTINKDDYLVATQDKLLKAKIKQKKVKIITLRQKKRLIIEGG